MHRVRAAVRRGVVRPAAVPQPAPGAPRGDTADPDPHIRPLVTLGVGALGGLLVGITSVGAGSVIMIALLMLYPGLSALRLVGTDLVQAVPLVLAAAASNIAINGLAWHILLPLVIGSTLGSGKDDTHPLLVAFVGLAMLVHVPLVWGLIRRTEGLPMSGVP